MIKIKISKYKNENQVNNCFLCKKYLYHLNLIKLFKTEHFLKLCLEKQKVPSSLFLNICLEAKPFFRKCLEPKVFRCLVKLNIFQNKCLDLDTSV